MIFPLSASQSVSENERLIILCGIYLAMSTRWHVLRPKENERARLFSNKPHILLVQHMNHMLFQILIHVQVPAIPTCVFYLSEHTVEKRRGRVAARHPHAAKGIQGRRGVCVMMKSTLLPTRLRLARPDAVSSGAATSPGHQSTPAVRSHLSCDAAPPKVQILFPSM